MTAARVEMFMPGEQLFIIPPESLSRRCAEIADQVVPRYRDETKPALSCSGRVAKQWQAAWNAACIALGGDPAKYPNCFEGDE